jgi:nicotinamidase-related amidase
MKTALVIVDMLEDFVHGALANTAAKSIIDPIASLAGRSRDNKDWVVLYANDAHRPDDIELRVFPPHAMNGTPGSAVIGELQPQPGDLVIDKRFYSAFTETDLDRSLRSLDVGRLVVVGQHTDCCIRHTSYDAFVRGYELVVCPDATAVFEPADGQPVELRQAQALDYLQSYYGACLQPAAALG